MKKIIFLILLIFSLIACEQKPESKQVNSATTTLQDSLAFELCQMYGLDQGIRNSKGFLNKMRLIQSIDTFSFEKLVDFVKTNGMPTKELVGEKNYANECVEAAPFAILLHNPHRLVNEKEYFNLFLNEVNEGRMNREALALVLDKYYWVKRDSLDNRKLLYGSQFGKPCLYNRQKSDSVRAIIGLPPLKESDFMDCF